MNIVQNRVKIVCAVLVAFIRDNGIEILNVAGSKVARIG
jgi:hypothetical protein